MDALGVGLLLAGASAVAASYSPADKTKLTTAQSSGLRTIGFVLAGAGAVKILWEALFGDPSEGGVVKKVADAVFGPTGPGVREDYDLPQLGDAPIPDASTQPIILGKGVPVSVEILSPQPGESVQRPNFESTISLVLNLRNNTQEYVSPTIDVIVSVQRTLEENTTKMTTLHSKLIAPEAVRRIESQVESGDYNQILFEFGKGWASIEILVNGSTAASTYCYIE